MCDDVYMCCVNDVVWVVMLEWFCVNGVVCCNVYMCCVLCE